jgi:trimeric autotransporter adhesin
MRHVPRIILALCLLPAVLPAAAAAAASCVSDIQGLVGELSAFNSGETVSIRLQKGHYIVDNSQPGGVASLGLFGDHDFAASIEIRGGYNHDCSSRDIDPSNTIIDGNGQPHTFLGVSANGTIVLEGITIQGLRGDSDYTPIWIAHDPYASQGSDTVIVDRSRIINNGGPGSPADSVVIGGLSNAGSASVRVQISSSVLADNAGNVRIINGGTPILNIADSTIANNAGPLLIEQAASDPGAVFVNNNIVWSAAFPSLDVTGLSLPPSATFNDIRTINGAIAPTTANISQDPQFEDATHGDYHLHHGAPVVPTPGQDSPAINAGVADIPIIGLPYFDIEGNLRLIGSKPDMGAYESPIDDRHVYTVTTVADNGDNSNPTPNSLRWAIANAKRDAHDPAIGGAFTIKFDTSCNAGIILRSTLPDIDFNLTVDGTSHPDWIPNTASAGFNGRVCVPLYGVQHNIPYALRSTGDGRLAVKGVTLYGFSTAALILNGGHADVEGSYLIENQNGINVAASSGWTRIGGLSPETRNVISGNQNVGVALASATGFNQVYSNLIGLADNGFTPYPNGKGLLVASSPGNVVRFNTISASLGTGLTLQGVGTTGALIQYNAIGYPEVGLGGVSNGATAVQVTAGAHDNTIGAQQRLLGGGNAVASDTTGIWIDDTAGTGNQVLGNRIVAADGLAMDLDESGPTPNGATSTDVANHTQHHPVVRHAFRTASYEWIELDLDTTSGQAFLVELYASSEAGAFGRGQMETSLTQVLSPTTDSNGHTHFWVRSAPSTGDSAPQMISATATATQTVTGSSAGDTSEIGEYVSESFDMIFRDDLDPHD